MPGTQLSTGNITGKADMVPALTGVGGKGIRFSAGKVL